MGEVHYDGSIHISGDLARGEADLYKSLAHEYVHHVLNSVGIREPFWFHEGVGMYVAGEDWWLHPQALAYVTDERMFFDDLVWAFPHGADQAFATAVYVQAIMMVRLVVELRGEAALAELAYVLRSGQLDPLDAFEYSTGLKGKALDEAFSALVRRAR